MITVRQHQVWEYLCAHPGAVAGDWYSETQCGTVYFPGGGRVVRSALAEIVERFGPGMPITWL